MFPIRIARIVVLCGLVALALGQVPGTPVAARTLAQDATQITHIVFIIKENHTFDNYFGTFPGADGATTGRLSTGQVVTLGHTPDPLLADIEHTPQAAQIGFDHGKMDGFDKIPDAIQRGSGRGDESVLSDGYPQLLGVCQPFPAGRPFLHTHSRAQLP